MKIVLSLKRVIYNIFHRFHKINDKDNARFDNPIQNEIESK